MRRRIGIQAEVVWLWKVRMPFVTSRGCEIHYSVEGSGPLVILLHGLLSNAKSWKRWGFVDALADGYCVACVDSLGHGHSDKPSDESLYGLEARSRDVEAVMDSHRDSVN